MFVVVKAPALEQQTCKPANQLSAQVEEQRAPAGIQGLPQVPHELDFVIEAWLELDAPGGFQLVHHLGNHVPFSHLLHLLPAQRNTATSKTNMQVHNPS